MTLALSANADVGPAESTLTKTQIVEAILEVNATASREWLMSFDFAALRGYFLRLQHAVAPRGSTWARPRSRPGGSGGQPGLCA